MVISSAFSLAAPDVSHQHRHHEIQGKENQSLTEVVERVGYSPVSSTILRIPGDGDQRFPNDRDRDSWVIVISVPTEGDQ